MSQNKKVFYQAFHENLKMLLEHAQKLIQAPREPASYQEEVVSLLAITIDDLQKSSEHVLLHSENEELKFDARLVQNVLHEPLFLKNNQKKLSLHTAAKLHQTTQDPSEMKELIKACRENSKYADVMLCNLQDIHRSFHEEMKKEG